MYTLCCYYRRYDHVKQMINIQSSARQPGDTALMVAVVNRNFDAFHQLIGQCRHLNYAPATSHVVKNAAML